MRNRNNPSKWYFVFQLVFEYFCNFIWYIFFRAFLQEWDFIISLWILNTLNTCHIYFPHPWYQLLCQRWKYSLTQCILHKSILDFVSLCHYIGACNNCLFNNFLYCLEIIVIQLYESFSHISTMFALYFSETSAILNNILIARYSFYFSFKFS